METRSSSESEKSRQEAAQHVAKAHGLLKDLKSDLERTTAGAATSGTPMEASRHPLLEEAITRLESALNILSAKSSGLL